VHVNLGGLHNGRSQAKRYMGKVTEDGGAKSKQITDYAREQLILTDGREDVRSPNLRNLACYLNH